MRNLQDLHERHAAQSHRSFYVSSKLQSISSKQYQPPLAEIKALFSKATKLDFLVNPSQEKKQSLTHQKSLSNKISFFQTPVPNSQKTSFIINKATRHGASFFEKRKDQPQQPQPPNRPFLDQLELKKLDFIRAKDRERERERDHSPLIGAPEGNYIGKANFEFLYIVGKGGFGKVWKVCHKKTRRFYAMKEMSKAKVISKRSVHSVMNERELLQGIRHPFLINITFAFQDRENLYLVMDLMNGGDLRYHIGRNKRFSENTTRFFIACIMESLEYLHVHSIIHRDLKPENLVLDDRGYVHLTDLGVARILKAENSSDTSGTPGYMAPEVMCRLNHGIAVDYFALGVIGYEFMYGRRPYLGRDRKEIREAILAKQVLIKKSEIPNDWSVEAADFINRLLQRKPANRLGTNGPQEVKNHPWLRDFPWEKLKRREIQAPFIPNPKDDNFDAKQAMSTDTMGNDETLRENLLLLRRNSIQELFSGYFYEGNTIKSAVTERNTSKSIATSSTASSLLV